jgi:hypothetical protein
VGHDNLEAWFARTVPELPHSRRVAHVQCDSRVTCKQNLIKTKVGNMLGNKNLEAILRITLEGLD